MEAVEQIVRELTEDFARKERQRIECCERTLSENTNLQENISLAKSYGKTLVKRCDDLESKVQSVECNLQQEQAQSKLCRHQNDSLNSQVERLQADKDTYSIRIGKLEKERNEWHEKEKDYTKELLDLEKLLKASNQDANRLSVELNSEKSASRLALEQKEREMQMQLDDLQSKWQTRLQDEKSKLTAEKDEESRKLKSQLRQLTQETNQRMNKLEGENNGLRTRVREFERSLDARQQMMCAQLQHKLANKYQELLSEFGTTQQKDNFVAKSEKFIVLKTAPWYSGNVPPPAPGTTAIQCSSGNAEWMSNEFQYGCSQNPTGPLFATTEAENMHSSGIDENYRLRMHNAKSASVDPFQTPLSPAFQDLPSGRKQQLQQYLKQVLNKPLVPPPIHSAAHGGPYGPPDPDPSPRR